MTRNAPPLTRPGDSVEKNCAGYTADSSVKVRPISSIARRPPTYGVTWRPGHSTVSDDASDTSLNLNGAPQRVTTPSAEPAARSTLQTQSRRKKFRSDRSTASMPVGGNRLAPLGAAKTDW